MNNNIKKLNNGDFEVQPAEVYTDLEEEHNKNVNVGSDSLRIIKTPTLSLHDICCCATNFHSGHRCFFTANSDDIKESQRNDQFYYVIKGI